MPNSQRRKDLRSLIALLTVLFAAACAQKGAIEEPRELESFDARYDVNTVWTHRARGRAERLFLGLRPDTDGERVYVAGHGGRVAALSADRGRTVWSVDLDAELAGGPRFGERLVFVGSLDGRLFALDAEDGRERWSTQVGGEILAAPAVSRGYVIVKTADGRVRGLAIDDGAELWSRSEDPPALKMRGNAEPIIRGNRVLVGFENGRVRAISFRDGQSLWGDSVGVAAGRTELDQIADIAPLMAASEDMVYAASADGRLAAISMTGSRRWDRDIGSLAGLSIDESMLYLSDRNSEIHGLGLAGGASVWIQDALRARQVTAPVVYRDTVVVGDLDGYVHFLDVETGELVARTRVSRKRINVAPVIVGDSIVVQDGNGRVRALQLRDRN